MVAYPALGQDFNRYSYVLNNPLALEDPSGYMACYSENINKNETRWVCQNDDANGWEGDGPPCWYCTGPSLTSDAYGDPVPASNFGGGWNAISMGWNGPDYGAPDCSGTMTSGCWTPYTTTFSSSGITEIISATHSYWVPGAPGISWSWGGSDWGLLGGNCGARDAGMNLPPQTYWGIAGAALGQYAGKLAASQARQMGLDNLRQWGEQQGMSSFEIDELIAAAEGAEDGGTATAEFGPWAIGGAVAGGLLGLGAYYLWEAFDTPPATEPSGPAQN